MENKFIRVDEVAQELDVSTSYFSRYREKTPTRDDVR